MNKSKQKENNNYIDYWTKRGLEAKETNAKQKITTEPNKFLHHPFLHHPKLNELTFETKTAKLKPKLSKEERYEKLPFSHKHNLLVAQAYGKENRLLKQQTARALHEKRIKEIIEQQKDFRFKKTQESRKEKEKTNWLVVYRLDRNKLPYAFSSNPSNKSIEELRRIGEGLRDKLEQKWEDFASIRIYTQEGIKKDYPRYYIYKHAA
jgi:hypothetical protein